MCAFGTMILSHRLELYIICLLVVANVTKARPSFIENITATTTGSSVSTKKNRILSHPNNPSRGDLIQLGEYIDDQGIIFPDSDEDVLDPLPRITGLPKCAKGETYCEEIDDYPTKLVKDALKRSNVNVDLFGIDEAPEEIANRVGTSEDTFLCASSQRTIFPKIGRTKANTWQYIVNQPEEGGHVQGVRVEICQGLNGPCDLIREAPSGYITSCKQKYVYRRLISLSNDDGHLLSESFQMPSACCCAYRRDVQFLARFGMETTPATRRK